MLFADTTLAARIEGAECRLLADCAAAAARRRPDSRVFVQDIAGGVAVYTGPDSPFNKVAGLGFAGALDETRLDEIEPSHQVACWRAPDIEAEAEAAP